MYKNAASALIAIITVIMGEYEMAPDTKPYRVPFPYFHCHSLTQTYLTVLTQLPVIRLNIQLVAQ